MRDPWEYVLGASPPQISIISRRLPSGEWMLRVSGELDAFTTSNFRSQLSGPLEDSNDPVLLDLSRLEFCDHTGLRMLRSVETSTAPGRIRIIAAHPCLGLVMRLCGLKELFGYQDKA